MSRTLVLITSLIMITTSASGCLSGDTVEDILGCMDENAANYDENATLEALGDCFFIATMETFIHTMDNQMTIDEMLDLNTRAGYSTVMYTNSSGGEGEMIALEGLHIEEHVMVDLSNNSAMVRTVLSMGPMISIDNQVIQVGQVVNVHNSVSGMMAADAGGAQSYSAQTRDVEGTVMDLVESMVADSFMSLMTMDDMMDDEDTESDVMDDMPEDLEASFSYDSSENSQSMVATYTEEGASTEMAIVLDDSSNLMSYTMTSVDGTNDSTIIHTVMWGDAVVIEVDDTLPKSATPVIFEGLNDFDPFEEEDDEEEGEGDDGPTAEEFLYMTDQNGDDQVSWSEIEDFFTQGDDYDPEAELAYLQSHFDTSDENGDGYLTDDEILLFISIFDEDEDGDDPSPEEVLQWFDMDGDDHLSWDEFWNSYSEGDESDEEISDLQEIFDASDDDGNSLLGIDELQYFIDMLIEYEDENDDGSSGPGDGTGSGCGDGSGDGDPNTPCDDDDDGSGGGSGDGSGGDDEGDGDDYSADEAFEWMNTDGDGQITPSEWADFANSTGDIIEEEDFNNLVYMMDMYDYDDSDGLDIYEFTEMWDEINNDDGDDEGDDDGYDDYVIVDGAGREEWNGRYDRVEDDCGFRGDGCRNNYQLLGTNKHIFTNSQMSWWVFDETNVGSPYRAASEDGVMTPPSDGWEVNPDVDATVFAPAPTLALSEYTETFTDLDIYGTGDLYDLTVIVYRDDFRVGDSFSYSDASYPDWNDDGDLEAFMEQLVFYSVEFEFDRELADGETGIVFIDLEDSEVGPAGSSCGGDSLQSQHEERICFQSHMAEYGLGPIGPEAGINSIEIMILNKTDPNNNPFVLDVGVIDLDFNILWSERMIESAYHHDDDTDGNYEVQVNFSRTVLSDENSVIKIYMWNYAPQGWEEIDASSLGNDDWDYYSCLDDYWCDEWDGVSQLMFELDTDEETHTAYYDPDTGVYYDFVAPDPPIESVYIDYMGGVVIIGVYGDFTTDSPPQYTLQFANGLISIYEDDNVMTWNYIEDGYAELYISTDILLGDTWFDVEFSVWTQDQTSDYATYELYSFYKPMMYDCDNGNEIPMDYVDDGYDDCGDGSDEDNSQFGTIADGLTFAAPISDFEIRFLNCNEVDSLDDCSLVASGTLESGIASAPAEVGCTLGCDIPFTFEDVDMDGMMSSGDTLSVDDSMGFYVAIYDTWAGQYTDDSTAGPVSLPGFGGFLAMICLIGASLSSRRN